MRGSELRAHIERKIAADELHRYPFPHPIVADFFPAPVYAEILRRNPFRGLGAPYASNHFLRFFKTRQSFHSVRAIDAAVPNQRYGMPLQLYEARGGIFTDLSEPDLFAPKLDRPALRTRLARAWSALTS